MTIPMNSNLLNTIARQAATSGVVVQSDSGQVKVEGNKAYGFAWLKNCVSSDARQANVQLKRDFVTQLRQEFNLKDGHVEAIKNRLGRSDTPLDLEQAKGIIKQLQSGDKFFLSPSENLKALKSTFATQLGFMPDATGKLQKNEDGTLARRGDLLTPKVTQIAADRSSLSTHVTNYLDAMDARRAEARPGEVIPDRATLKARIDSSLAQSLTTDVRLAARDDLVKLSNNGNNRLVLEKIGKGPESTQKMGGREVEDIVADRLVSKMKATADRLQAVTEQSKTPELRLNRMEQLLGITPTSFDRQITPTRNAPNTFA